MTSRVAAGVVLLALVAPAGARSEGSVTVFGNLRAGFFASERTARDGAETSAGEFKLRLRVGAEARLSDGWLVRGRVAGRVTTDQDRTRIWLKAWPPERTGLEDGDATVDELFLRYSPSEGRWSLRVGRFQSSFELHGVPAKGLDRNDSPNVDITWTDGLHWQYTLNPRWRSHVILQANASRGSGQVARSPLSFDHRDSRVTVFAGVEGTAPWGPVTQRMVAVTWMPKALATDGITAATRHAYLAMTARLFAEWPLGGTGVRGGLGGEVGYAPSTPRERLFDPGSGGDSNGVAWQISANLFEFAPRHHIGVVYGRAGAGWLISPDFRNNDSLLEVRHQWRFSRNWSMETRLRRRKEIVVPGTASGPRVDDDVYLRFSGKF